MKAVGTAILVFVVLAFSGDAVVAVAVGLLAGVLVWQIDQLDARIRILEQSQRVRDTIEGAPNAAAPTPDIASPPPAPAPETYWVAPKAAPTTLSNWGNPAAQAAPVEAAAERRGWNLPALGELEGLVAGRGLAIVGGTALTLGILFFLGLAFSRGWIGPEGRVGIGLVAGGLIFALGAWMLPRGRQIVAHVLVAVGLAALTLSLFAATQLYGFIPGDEVPRIMAS